MYFSSIFNIVCLRFIVIMNAATNNISARVYLFDFYPTICVYITIELRTLNGLMTKLMKEKTKSRTQVSSRVLDFDRIYDYYLSVSAISKRMTMYKGTAFDLNTNYEMTEEVSFSWLTIARKFAISSSSFLYFSRAFLYESSFFLMLFKYHVAIDHVIVAQRISR